MRVAVDLAWERATAGRWHRRRADPAEAPWEVIYPAQPYLEQGLVASPPPFSKTVLYSELDEGNTGGWYEAGKEPQDAATPLYVSEPYGGGDALRLETVVAAGGWTSTAPDMVLNGRKFSLACTGGPTALASFAFTITDFLFSINL